MSTEADTTEGRLADIIEEDGLVSIGKYQLSKHDEEVLKAALRSVANVKGHRDG